MAPNIIHFIFGLQEDFGGKPFSFVHYLAVRTAHEVNEPDTVYLHYKHEPSGHWWELARPYLNLVEAEPPDTVFGNPLTHYAHRADVMRLEILLEYGGTYLDMDVLCLRPFANLRDSPCTMGIEETSRFRGLCNAVIIADQGSEFLRTWHASYRTFRGDGMRRHWAEHSVSVPYALSAKHPDLIKVMDRYSFFHPNYLQDDILWGNSEQDFSRSYCVHLWENLWWDKYLKDLSPQKLGEADTNFSRLFANYRDAKEPDQGQRQQHPMNAPDSEPSPPADSPLKLNLGGTGPGRGGWVNVNLLPGCDIESDILKLDGFCEDNSVDEFLMSHTYEHIPSILLQDFVSTLLNKLKAGGSLTIIQSDIKQTLELYARGEIDFYCLRDVIFTPTYRLEENYRATGDMHLQSHKSMWGAEELAKELLHYGFSAAEPFDAGSWRFDLRSAYPFQENEKYMGTPIPNLGVRAQK